MAPVEIKTLGVPMPADLRKQIQDLADKNDRSAAAEARLAIKAHVDQQADSEPEQVPAA